MPNRRAAVGLASALLAFGWSWGACAAPAKLPATRDALAANLFGHGFSSVTSATKSNVGWSGQGVRHGVLMRFTIDNAGHLGMSPAK